MNVLVLYEELAGYTFACLRALVESQNARVLVVHRPVNAIAPFDLAAVPGVEFIDRSRITDAALDTKIADFHPDAVFCGGWMTPAYLRIARKIRARGPSVLGFDTWWNGTLRQRVRTFVGTPRLRRAFSACFVPGTHQAELARRIGFRDDVIAHGLYCCDQPAFASFGDQAREARGVIPPRRLLYVGRYSPEKGLGLLWQTFAEVSDEYPDWELWCAGTGPETPLVHPRVRHLGFVQPDQMGTLIRDCGTFVLPSGFEPWGVVMHEFAAAGLSIIASDHVGAGEQFLRDGENGFAFRHGDAGSLMHALRRIMSADDQARLAFAERSAALGAEHTPDRWAETLVSLFERSAPERR